MSIQERREGGFSEGVLHLRIGGMNCTIFGPCQMNIVSAHVVIFNKTNMLVIVPLSVQCVEQIPDKTRPPYNSNTILLVALLALRYIRVPL